MVKIYIMKILQRYILREHIGPFFLSIGIITFIMLLDRILDLLNLIIEKKLDLLCIVQVFGLSLPFMLALSIPMSVLVASIMAFGRLAMDNEITAIKASGTNIYTMMTPVVAASFILSICMVYFNNAILPETNHLLKNMLIDIHYKHPATELKPGLFTKIKNYSIYYHHKDHTDGMLKEIIIYDKKDKKMPQTIIAKKGVIKFTNHGNSLQAVLYNGQIHQTDQKDNDKYQLICFKKYTLTIPDLGIRIKQSKREYRSDREMSSKAMKTKIDDLRKDKLKVEQEQFEYEKQLLQLEDSKSSRVQDDKSSRNQEIKKTRVQDDKRKSKEERKLLSLIQMKENRIKDIEHDINRYKVEIHKKYSLAFACLLFVLVGAPLGMMTQSKGIGMGFAISAFIFLIYYLSLVAGEELADRGTISPFIAMWIANILFAILGTYLIIYSVRERKVINLTLYWQNFLKTLGIKNANFR